MSTIDIVILICFIPAIVRGIQKGFVEQAISLISIILGIWASFKFAEIVCAFLVPYLEIGEPIVHVISFVLIFLAVALILHFIEKLITKVIKLVMLGWLNKLLGVVFAMLKALLVIGVLVMLFNTINTNGVLVSEEKLAESVLYEPIKDFAYTVFPYFKELLLKQ